MRARGHAPAPHPARIPANRRDGGGRIEASRGASAVGTQHIAAPRPDPRQPERGPPVEGSSPLIDPPVTVTVACEPLRRPQEVVPRPVIRGIRNGRAVQEIPIVHDHQRRIAAGEAVYACTATENREDLRVVAGEVDADAGEVRCEIEGATAVASAGTSTS